MKKFRFKFTPLVWVLLGLVIALSVAGVAWNVYNLVSLGALFPERIATTAIMLAIISLVLIYALSVVIYSKYVVKGEYVYAYFGFIRIKNKAKDMVQFTHFKKSDKLVVYFADQKYSVIVISPELYEQFILAVREINPQIYYNTQIDGEEQP